MSISQIVTDYITLAIQHGVGTEIDRNYLQNRLLSLIGETTLEKTQIAPVSATGLELTERLLAVAVNNGVIADEITARDILEAKLTDLLTPAPSVVNGIFSRYYQKDPQAATDYFFELSKNNNYIKTKNIAKNIVFETDTAYGTLDITINLSKPEKDPKAIAAAVNHTSVSYPSCLLCMENEGYEGRLDHPARTNHRIIRLNVANEKWGLQYSPYAYYNEHCIVLSEDHRPMKISAKTFERLLKITQELPHYFVGSNADLPIVGGSILTHDHYQGGRYEFAMEKAPVEKQIELAEFPTIQAGIVKWPLSVLRLNGTEIDALVAAANHILETWQEYSDESLDIRAFSADGTPHHTITPIARRRGELFELDLVLRDNNISEEHPDGIFHPHQDVQHIKKENIGLIEVMGLAVLPPRLKDELVEVEKYLLAEENELAESHLVWADEIKANHAITKENVTQVVQAAVGAVFARVLEDCGVFKRNTFGQAGFARFIEELATIKERQVS
ncbi:MAG: UDP-glucose--hexose-1-phosphate uridylyltransferase [Enterococcus sp.]